MTDENKYSTKEQLEAFNRGEFLDRCFYFYDWFCKKRSLERKSKSLIPKVKKFIKVAKVDVDNTYVFFKNNCPFYGQLYDDFRICDRSTGDVIWTVIPKSGHKGSKCELWGRLNDFEKPILEVETWSKLIKTLELDL